MKAPTRTWREIFWRLDPPVVKHVAEKIVAHGTTADGWARERHRELMKHLRVRGFSSASSAPAHLQRRAVADALPKHWEAAWFGLGIWMDSNRPLCEQVRLRLAPTPHALMSPETLRPTPDHGTPEADLERLEEEMGLPLDSFSPGDVRLMLCCVLGTHPAKEKLEGAGEESEESPDDVEETEGGGNTSDGVGELQPRDAITQLNEWVMSGSLGEEDWTALSGAMGTWTTEAVRWRLKRSEAAEVDAAILSLRERHGAALAEAFGENPPCLSADALRVPAAEALQVLEQVGVLLSDYQRLEEQKGGTLDERRSRHEQLAALVAAMEKGAADLHRMFGSVPPPEATDRSTSLGLDDSGWGRGGEPTEVEAPHPIPAVDTPPGADDAPTPPAQRQAVADPSPVEDSGSEPTGSSTLPIEQVETPPTPGAEAVAVGSATEEGVLPESSQEDAHSGDHHDRTLATTSTATAESTATPPIAEVVAAEAQVCVPEAPSPGDSEELVSRAAKNAWRAIAAGKPALAYHLAKAAAPSGAAGAWTGPSSDLACLIVFSRFAGASGEIDGHLESALTGIANAEPLEEADARRAYALLAGIAALRPALLMSSTAAFRAYESLALDDLGPLRAIRELLRNFQRTGIVLQPPLLREIQEHAQWAAECERLRCETASWLERAQKMSVLCTRGTNVWREWVEPNGPIGRLLKTVVDGDVGAGKALRTDLRVWTQPDYVAREIQRTDQELLGPRKDKAKRERLEARAKTALLQHAADAVKRMQLWLDLLDARPTPGQVHSHGKASELRSGLLGELQNLEAMVRALVSGSPSWPLGAAAEGALLCLSDAGRIFGSDTPDPVPPASTASLLARPLLLVLKSVPCTTNDDGSRTRPELADLLSGLLEHEPSLREALRFHCDTGDLESAREVLALVEEEDADASDLTALRVELQDSERSLQLRVAERISRAEEEIGRAASHDLLTESERLEYRARLADIGRDPLRAQREDGLALFDEVTERIGERKESRLTAARDRLAALRELQPGADVALVESCLGSGDFVTAGEYLDQLEAGNPIQPTVFENDPFERFFPKFIKEWASVRGIGRELVDNRKVIEAVRNRSSIPPLDFGPVGGAQIETAAKLVENWFRAKGRVGSYTLVLSELLSGLGFDGVRVESDGGPQARTWIGRLTCTPVESADLCPVPQFGSQTHGRYRLLCVFERPSAEELANSVESLGSGNPVIVLYFGRLTDQQRRDVAFICRTRHRTFIVVDECLVAFLCAVRGARLPVLFACALPFTTCDPYVTSSGSLPPEIFVGRERELQAIWEPAGTNLVFGGRQLGKTALLREVERRRHLPDQGVVVRWLDLKAALVGGSVPPADLWRVLSEDLARFGVVSEGTHTPERFAASVEKWLKPGARRLVLLLDEADLFLEADQRDKYPVLLQLKNLMEKTKRLFKVVFAGLHNVQRTARDVNTPLAHLGEPLCIGPLIAGGEIREAMALIRRPLRALGFQFAETGPDPVVRILAFTNYYPGLIQLYCKHLLAYLADPNRCSFDSRTTPPYTVTHEHLDRAHDHRLRDQIHQRFRLTLDLDQRYRVIALCIALRALEEDDKSLFRDGVDVAWVREQVLYWWSKGFAATANSEEIRAILDEMIGLGLLRRTASHGYTLRSPNVMNVLGKKGDIEEDLLSSQDREPPPPYEAAAFHRASPAHPALRSPLTAQQEADVLHSPQGVSILFGVPAAGLSGIEEFIRLAVGAEAVRTVVAAGSQREFVEKFSDCLRSRREGLNVIVVPPSALWEPVWVRRAAEKLHGEPQRKTSSYRIVFVGGSEAAWAWVSPHDETRRKCQTLGVVETTLHPWSDAAVKMWLQDLAVTPNDATVRAEIEKHSGFWPGPLGVLGEQFNQGVPSVTEALRRSESRLEAILGDPSALGVLEQPARMLKDLAILGDPISLEDCPDLLGADVDDPEWKRSIEWSELLGLANRSSGGRFALDRFAQKCIIRMAGG